MHAKNFKWATLLILAMAFGCPLISRSLQAGTPASTIPVSMIVSVEAKRGKEVPTIYKEDVRAFQGRDRLSVQEWVPFQGDHAGLELFILIDDSNTVELGLQFDDLRKFIQAQPESTAVGIGYIRNGAVEVLQNLTQDHALAAKALRLPFGSGGVTASPYTAITDLIQRWPQSTSRREIFLVSSGIDELQPGPNDTYLDQAIERAQTGGVQVYSIYASRAGHFGHTFWRYNWGQNNLSRLADETGGEAYFQALEMPISYEPYLTEFADRLKHQYRLTVLARASKKGRLEKIRLETEVPNAELVVAEYVNVQPAK